MKIMHSGLACAAGILALANAAGARADTFTVTAGDAASLQSALTQAANHPNSAGADIVSIPAGTYVGSFTYSGDAVDLIGSGESTTELQDAAAGSTTLDIGAAGSTVSGLTIDNTASTYGYALKLEQGGDAHDVDLHATGNAVSAFVGGGSSSLTRVHIALGPNDSGVHTSGPATLTISQMALDGAGGGSAGVESDSPGASVYVSRLRSTAVPFAVRALFGGSLTIRDSLIVLPTGIYASGLDAGDTGNATDFTSTLTADRVTVVGDPSTGQTGALAIANSAGDNFGVSVHDAIFTGIATPLRCGAPNGTAHVTADWSSLPPTGDTSTGVACSTTRTNPVAGAPIFVDATGGDYHQRPDSPLIDAGDPAPFAPTDDLDGLPRPVGRVDLGAYEYQPAIAPAPGDGATTAPAPASSAASSAPDLTPPAVTLLVKRHVSLAQALRRGIRVTIGCSEACTYRVNLLLHGRVGSRRISLPSAGRRAITIRLTRRGRASLRHLRRALLRVQATATDTAGNAGRARSRTTSVR